MRTPMLLFPLSLLLFGCPAAPGLCSACPPIQGHWVLTYQPLDAGDVSPGCAMVPPPGGPATIEILRNGALLHATLDGIDAQGQLTESYDFSISGTQDLGGDAGNIRQVSLRGYYAPGSPVFTQDAGADGGADAGVDTGARATLQARWVTHTEQGSKACDAQQRCVGTRN